MIALRVIDRVGVLYSCTKVLAEAGINIISVHVFPMRREREPPEANIVIFVDRLDQEVMNRLRGFDFVLDLRIYRLSSRDTSKDMVVMPISSIQEVMKLIFEHYGEPVFASLFYRIGYLQGYTIANEYFGCATECPDAECEEISLAKLHMVLNVLKVLNFIRGYTMNVMEHMVEICVEEPIEMRTYSDSTRIPCHYTRGLLQGLCDCIFKQSKVVSSSDDATRRCCCFYVYLGRFSRKDIYSTVFTD